ncbi:hypothetical protein QQ045_021625 [Rhodiola kirilowii]
MSGNILDSLGELKMLSVLKLERCNLQGSIPSSLTQLPTLTYLDLSSNELSGQIPSLSRSKNLKYLSLGGNKLMGSILGTNWSDLSQLEKIHFYGNALSGSIPTSLFGIPTLQMLFFDRNQFTKFTSEPVNISSSQLETLVLSHNDLQGPFPSFIFKLQALRTIDVEFNNFNGTFYMDSLQQLRNLSVLALSYNSMSIEFGENLTFLDSFQLGLASCKLKAFPKFLKNNTKFQSLDLSANQIRGEIPHWIWNILGFQSDLNLSHNQLQTFESPLGDFQYHEVSMLDLSSNKLYGKIPQIPSAHHLDLSHNLFGSIVFSSINIAALDFLSISNNLLQGSISKLLCDVKLSFLELSSNFLSDILPSCLPQMPSLRVLNLKSNNISGIIPDLFPVGCGLLIVTLNGNSLVGSIPKSLTNCTSLEFLDLGNNKLHDGFSCWMSSILTLEVLVLESNMLEGSIICPGVNVTWPSLQILDIASNNFSGKLPSQQLIGWKAMMINEEATSMLNRYPNYIRSYYTTYSGYLDDDDKLEVALTLKSIEVILEKISTSLTLIDMSDNAFEGTIPEEFGYFNALFALNMSHNDLRGQIPSSIRNMKRLESLDLQKNHLSGKIPAQLASLNFLSFLNLSFNQLEGMIPNGRQLQTFTEYSFLHNKGLCGSPLNTSCAKDVKVKPLPKPFFEVEGSVLISAEVGYAVGLGLIIMPLLFWTRWRMKFYEITDNILLKIFSLTFQRTQDSNRDCCGWPGVACSKNGYVTGLDLSYECIERGLNNSSPLFELQYLTNLNLAGNILQWRADMSSGFERLVNLMHLNMSFSSFSGRFPIEISNLTRLVTLDLSYSYCDGTSNSNSHINLGMLISNMSKLTQLWLDRVDYLGVQGSEWFQAQLVSSYLPRLQVLSLSGFGLWGSINSFTQLKTLTYLDLSFNHNMSGNILDSLGKLKMLSVLKLEQCNLQGSILSSLTQLTTLTYLDLSSNELSGQIPSLSRSKNLKYLALGSNKLMGSILGTNWSDLSQLEQIDFYGNALSGIIPASLFGISTLQMLFFGSNHFANFTSEPVNISSSQLEALELSHNKLQGPFPSFIFKLQALRNIDIRGEIPHWIWNILGFRSSLNLSHNQLQTFESPLGDFQYHELDVLDLSSNKLYGKIPQIPFASYLDLSHNLFKSIVFSSINISVSYFLSISNNRLQGSISKLFCNAKLSILDPSSNFLSDILQSCLPQMLSLRFLNLDNNSISGIIPDLFPVGCGLLIVTLNGNSLLGSIPKSLTNCTSLEVLDLSSNFLSDILPSYLPQMPSLQVLKLKNNSISGIIPDLFPVGCGLQIVTLNGNSLKGSIPKSLTKCTSLEVLDLGNNKLHGGFPCRMSSILTLEVLVLESNMLEGSIICPRVNVTWPSLQILDIASNNFSGNLPSQQLLG